MDPLKILLVDDHTLFRQGIAALLSTRPDIKVVDEAENGLQALEKARYLKPDIILMDIEMPLQNGLETTKQIKKELPDIQIIMLTVSDDDEHLFEAIKNGAQGYLLKDLEPDQLFDMLEKIRQNEAPLSGVIAAKILHELREPAHAPSSPSSPAESLTEREIQVLEQLVTGATNHEIAETLHITKNTVKIHLRNILKKLHVNNRVQAAVQAVRQGLVGKE